jgi:hypothetical protein
MRGKFKGQAAQDPEKEKEKPVMQMEMLNI